MDLRRIDVLRVTYENKIEEFHKGDIIKVTIRNPWGDIEKKGRLALIDTLEITLDCSKEYKKNIEVIKLGDISKIEWV